MPTSVFTLIRGGAHRTIYRTISGGVRSLALFLIAIYRTCFSAFLSPRCRFEPSCSAYARDAFTLHPPARAFALTARRLCKCHPLGSYGYDPVPERTTS